MSNVSFKCPGCHKDLVVSSSVKVEKIDDLIDAKCSSCGRVIRKDDLAKQAREHAEKMLKNAIRKR
ncbi:ECs_2282 family putative zinc-binding protein [Shigella sp. FC1967]